MITAAFCSQQILERGNIVPADENSPPLNEISFPGETKLRFVEAKLGSNDTKFRLILRNFVSIHRIACKISPTLEQ